MRWHINIEMFWFLIILWAALSELDGIFLLNKEQITAELKVFLSGRIYSLYSRVDLAKSLFGHPCS